MSKTYKEVVKALGGVDEYRIQGASAGMIILDDPYGASINSSPHPIDMNPDSAIALLTSYLPRIWRYLQEVVKSRFTKHRSQFIKPCFLSMDMYLRVLTRYCEHQQMDIISHCGLLESGAGLVNIIAPLCAWHYTKFVYRIDPTLYEELCKTEFEGPIPADVILRIPNFSVYVELPPSAEFAGFWFCLSQFKPEPIPGVMLQVLLRNKYGTNIGECFTVAAIPIMSSEATIEHALKLMEEAEWNLPGNKYMKTLINVILYICSTQPDIKDRSSSVKCEPFNINKINMGNSWKLMPPKQQKIFDVGSDVGISLKQNYELHKGNMQKVRPHIRRAHWHGYWTGPLDGKREFVLKWLPPMPVATKNGSEQSNETANNG